MKNYQAWSSRTLEFGSNLKPWINLKESVSFMQQKPFSMAPFYFYRSFFFISLTPKPYYATEMELYSHEAMLRVKEWSPRKHQVKSGRPKRWSRTDIRPPLHRDQEQPVQRKPWPTSELQQARHSLMPRCVGLWKTKFCGSTVLNEIKETFFAWTQISWILKLFSWGCNLQKKKKRIKISHFQQFILFLKINFTIAWF